MKVLTSADIRAIRTALVRAGIVCHVVTGDGNVRLDLNWKGLDEVDRMNGLEIAIGLIRETVSGISVHFGSTKSRFACSLLVG